MTYFPVTSRMPMISLESVSTSATSSSTPMESAKACSADSVIGIGQNSPSAIFMSVQTPRQSASFQGRRAF
jgi:hypothetical protein